jgi:hypothetical protein
MFERDSAPGSPGVDSRPGAAPDQVEGPRDTLGPVATLRRVAAQRLAEAPGRQAPGAEELPPPPMLVVRRLRPDAAAPSQRPKRGARFGDDPLETAHRPPRALRSAIDGLLEGLQDHRDKSDT